MYLISKNDSIFKYFLYLTEKYVGSFLILIRPNQFYSIAKASSITG